MFFVVEKNGWSALIDVVWFTLFKYYSRMIPFFMVKTHDSFGSLTVSYYKNDEFGFVFAS